MTGRIRKVAVCPGVSWVEFPEADLRVMCGCPADGVKHLMRRGLIVPAETAGIAHETGPNVILLSDVALQNGNFCNLAEFPVLQMLYRQGLILPGHPNNTGAKPLLIGGRSQVDAQLEYIYRGNYGLISREEMIAAGVAHDIADMWMTIKLRFAFGRIRSSRDLLDCLYLGDKPIEIRNGVTLRRLDLNVFEFRHGSRQADETVVVDLNLPTGGGYTLSYPLGAHQVRRDYFSVLHTGDGDGWDVNRPAMGSILTFQGRVYLIDAGPGLQQQLVALGIGINEIEGLFLTHAHDDHFAGITTLLSADHRIKVFATAPVWSAAVKKLAAMMTAEESDFAAYFDIRPLTLGQWNDIEGLEVRPIFSPHPVETTALHFRALWAGGYKTYSHLADAVPLGLLREMITATGLPPALYDQVAADYAFPADVKKIDVGGGLIHGQAADFEDDRSAKLILAHTARILTASEKEIGSGAPFGTADALIQGQQDHSWRKGHEWLSSYFPGTPAHELRLLLNSPMVSFNPETILLREGGAVDAVHLILTGTVETIGGGAITGLLSAGAMVGEVALIGGGPANMTYRAASFVTTIAIPEDLYRAFVARNGLLDGIRTLQERRAFLRSTWLFADAMSNSVLNRLAQQMEAMAFPTGGSIEAEGRLIMIRQGNAERRLAGEVIEALEAGQALGEEAVFDSPTLAEVVAITDTLTYTIDAQLLKDIPVVRWKLVELLERWLRKAIKTGGILRDGRPAIAWCDDYAVNVGRIDAQHRIMVDRANLLLASWGHDHHRAIVAMDFLADYCRFHFAAEESLMHVYGHDGLATHRERHHLLLEQLRDVRRRVGDDPHHPIDELLAFLQGWIVEHIQTDDRPFAALLNAKGIF